MSGENSKTILLVEDEVLIALSEEMILKKYGYRVVTAHSGEEAIKIAERTPGIDLILMDIDLGKGIDGTRAAVEILGKHNLPLIFLSSHTEREIVEKTEGITSYGYIVKHSGETVLMASIKMAFRLYDAFGKEKEKEAALRRSEQNYRDIFDNAVEGIYRISVRGEVMQANRALASMIGYDSPQEVITTITSSGDQIWLRPEERTRFIGLLEKQNGILGYETRFKRKDGSVIWVSLSSRVSRDNEGNILYYDGFIKDITDRKKIEEVHLAHERILQFSMNHSLDELLEETINIIENLSDSLIGFFHFVDQDQKSLILQNWSTRTKKEFCSAEGKGAHYAIERAGVWADCVRQRRPLIHNDYASLPHKKGLPPGHAPMVRELVVPVIRDSMIVAILGVGNKASDYTEHDIFVVSMFANLVWSIIEHKRSAEKLFKNEQNLRLLFENMDEGFSLHEIITDADGAAVDFRFLDANEAHERYTGWKHRDVIGRTMLELMPQADPAQIARYGRVAMTGEPYTFEYFSRSFGKQLRVHAFSPQKGQFATIFMDITDSTLAKEELQNEKSKLDSIIAAMTSGLTIRDRDYRLIYQSPLSVELFGDQTGNKCHQVFQHRDTICENCPVELAFRDGASHTSVAEVILPNGDVSYWENTANPIKDSSGGIVSCLEINTNITERKKAEAELRHYRDHLEQLVAERTAALEQEIIERRHKEEALRQSENKYRTIVDFSTSIVLEWDTGGTVLYLNKYGLDFFGFTAGEILGRNVVGTIVPPVDSAGFDLGERMNHIQRNPDDYYSSENENIRKNGEKVWIAWTNKGIYSDDGTLVKTISVGIDRTRQKKEIQR